MASISQFVLHPTVSQSLKLGSTTLGRDKLYRAIQYFARFYAWYLASKGNKDAAVRWTALKSHLAIARKLLRLGKPLEHLQATARAAIASPSPTDQILTVGRQLAYAGFLSLDAVVWAQTVKFISLSPETAQRVARVSNRFWLTGILFSLIHSISKTVNISKRKVAIRREQGSSMGEKVELETEIRKLESARGQVRRQLTQDALDLWIPASALGLTSLNEGFLGIFGLITSLMALQKQWESLGGKK